MERIEIEKEILEEKKSISHLRGFLIAVAVGVIVGFSLFYYNNTKQLGRQNVDASVFDVRLQNLDDTTAAHEKRLTKLEEQMKALPAAGSARADQVPSDINERLNALEKAANAPKTRAGVQNSEQVYAAITLLSSFHHVSAKILSGKPFAAELAAFQEKFNADGEKTLAPIITPLMPYADSGVPSVSTLISEFDEAAASVKGHDGGLLEGAGLWDKFIFNISRMVSVRRTDRPLTGNTSDAIIGRASDDLSGDSIDAALKEIQSLPETQRSAFAAWIQDAQAASIASSSVDQMEEQVMQKAFGAAKQSEPKADQ